MIVRMVVAISGSRNDSAWPAPGSTLEVPDAEGQELFDMGLAVPVGEADAEPEPEAPLEDLKSAAVDYAESEAAADPEQSETEQSQDSADGSPKPAASKQEWVDWAVSQGAEWVTATNSTKQQLMEQYGQRP